MFVVLSKKFTLTSSSKFIRIINRFFSPRSQSNTKFSKLSLEDNTNNQNQSNFMVDDINLLNTNDYEMDLDKSDLLKEIYFFKNKGNDKIESDFAIESNIKMLTREIKSSVGPVYPPNSNLYINNFFNKLINKGSITNDDIIQIEKIKPKGIVVINENHIFENFYDALSHIRLIPKYSDSIKLRLILNINRHRFDHKIEGSIKLPNKLKANKICFITNSENLEKSMTQISELIIDANNLDYYLNNLDVKNIPFNRIVCLDSTTRIISNFNETLTSLKVDSHHLTCKSVEQAIYVINCLKNGEEYFNNHSLKDENILDINIGLDSLSDKEIIENINFALNTIIGLKPKSILGKFIMCGYLTSNNQNFRVSTSVFNLLQKKGKFNMKDI